VRVISAVCSEDIQSDAITRGFAAEKRRFRRCLTSGQPAGSYPGVHGELLTRGLKRSVTPALAKAGIFLADNPTVRRP